MPAVHSTHSTECRPVSWTTVVHPTFLYELLWNLLVFAVLIYVDRRFKIGHGRLFALYVAGYCLGRFWIELMRSDAATQIAGIRVNSFTATFVFIGAVVYIMVAPKGREDPATLKGKPREVAEAKVPAKEETSIEEFVKELTGVAAATTGVVAAAKVAGQSEDEDAQAAVDDEAEVEPDKPSEAATEAEELAEDVEEAPSEDIAEAEEFAEAKEAAEEAEPVGSVGAVEGGEAVEAEVAAPEAYEAAVDAVEEAEEIAAEVADTSADEAPEADAEPVDESAEGAEPTEGADEPGPEAVDAAEAERRNLIRSAVWARSRVGRPLRPRRRRPRRMKRPSTLSRKRRRLPLKWPMPRPAKHRKRTPSPLTSPQRGPSRPRAPTRPGPRL